MAGAGKHKNLPFAHHHHRHQHHHQHHRRRHHYCVPLSSSPYVRDAHRLAARLCCWLNKYFQHSFHHQLALYLNSTTTSTWQQQGAATLAATSEAVQSQQHQQQQLLPWLTSFPQLLLLLLQMLSKSVERRRHTYSHNPARKVFSRHSLCTARLPLLQHSGCVLSSDDRMWTDERTVGAKRCDAS